MVTGFYYFGPVSAVVLVVPVSMYLFALGQALRSALGLMVVITAPHIALTLLIAFDVIEDRGVIQPLFGAVEQIAYLAVIQFVNMACFVMGRVLRRSTLESIEELDRAVRGMAQREALLNEARQELERALKVGGPGRFTGQQLGSYRVGNLLGRGAMGEVYEGVHVDTGDQAAVKVLTASAHADPNLIRRFYRELEIASSLDVPNVVKVLEVPTGQAPIPYLAMERLRGASLSDLLREQPRMPVDEVVEMVRQLAAGVTAAHGAGIVHRDLKPGNVFRHGPANGAKPVWKIVDFGVSKLADGGGTLTEGQVIGTPVYMAPEQASGGDVDARADVYALGAVAYRALTGRPPFSGSGSARILYSVVHEMPPRPSEAAPLDRGFDVLLAVALAKDVELRFQSPGAFSDALSAVASGEVSESLRERAFLTLQEHPWHVHAGRFGKRRD